MMWGWCYFLLLESTLNTSEAVAPGVLVEARFFRLHKRNTKNSSAAKNTTPPTTPPIMGPRGRVEEVVDSDCGAGVCSCDVVVVAVVVVVVSRAEVDVVGSGVVDEVVKTCVRFAVETMVAFCAHVGFGMITSIEV